MFKQFHEIRDPLYGFIRYTLDERRVIDSRPVQRLRHIHQLATTNLVYPAATHKRFEHSLGVMELATQIYDVLTHSESLKATPRIIQDNLPELNDVDKIRLWRRVLRMAALCHDIGHLPFSHAAEKQLLPKGYTHETMTWELIHSDEMSPIWQELRLQPEDIAKIAVGAKESPTTLTPWEAIVSEIIVGDIFGADRMDYLLRDAHHTGVAYGHFDYKRLINTMRILPKVPEGCNNNDHSKEPSLGVEIGGLQAAESLLWARYLMFSQVYFHHVRRAYDIHLQEFMLERFGSNRYPISIQDYLDITDNEVSTSIARASSNENEKGHEPASCIMNRRHFKKVYQKTSEDSKLDPLAAETLGQALGAKFGLDNVRYDDYTKPTVVSDFPVWIGDELITSGLQQSQVLQSMPSTATGYVFVRPTEVESAQKWLDVNKDLILKGDDGGINDG